MQNRLVLAMKRKQAGKRLTDGCNPQESNANKLEAISKPQIAFDGKARAFEEVLNVAIGC
jgi:hypothetical protein